MRHERWWTLLAELHDYCWDVSPGAPVFPYAVVALGYLYVGDRASVMTH